MGCPAKNVAASGSGAALIRTPELAREIVRETRRGIDDWVAGHTLDQLGLRQKLRETVTAANLQRSGWATPPVRRAIPLSVKTRIGYDQIVIEDWIANLLAERPVAISIHGRTLKQGYKGDADWDAISRAVETARPTATPLAMVTCRYGDVYRRVRHAASMGFPRPRRRSRPGIFKAKERLKQGLAIPRRRFPASPSVRPSALAYRRHSRHFKLTSRSATSSACASI